MKDYQHSVVPFYHLVALAKQARADKEEWVQRALLTLAVSDEPGLKHALVMKLKLRALVEQLDPFPFDIPLDSDFES